MHLVGKYDVCKVLIHFFGSQNILAFPKPATSLSKLLRKETPPNSITIIVLSNDNKMELPPAYQSGGRIVSCLFIDTVEEARQWLTLQKKLTSQPPSNISILAQWNPHYIKLGTAWIKSLKTHLKINVNNWMADEVGKTRLLDFLQKDIQTCLYFGHGRPQKIVGYHGISANEIIQTVPSSTITCFLSFSCYHLHCDKQQPSFGELLIKSQKVATFWGSRIATDKILNTKLGGICRQQFSEAKNVTISDWINSIGAEIEKEESSSLRSIWESYSLLGNPLQHLK